MLFHDAIYFIQTISGVWKFLLECGAGSGFVLIARWYIPRLSAYSELGGFLFPIFFYTLGTLLFPIPPPYSILFTISGTLVSVAILTLLTPPPGEDVLREFEGRVRPPGYLWNRWRQERNLPPPEGTGLGRSFSLTLLGLGLVYSGLFGIGGFLFGYRDVYIPASILFLCCGMGTFFLFPGKERESNL